MSRLPNWKAFPLPSSLFTSVAAVICVERIGGKKIDDRCRHQRGRLAAFNFLFGQSLNAGKYVTIHDAVCLLIVWSLSGWSGVSIQNRPRARTNHRKILRFFFIWWYGSRFAAVEMAQIILTGGSIMERISISHLHSNNYVLNFIKFGGKRTTALYFGFRHFFALAQSQFGWHIKRFGIKAPKAML